MKSRFRYPKTNLLNNDGSTKCVKLASIHHFMKPRGLHQKEQICEIIFVSAKNKNKKTDAVEWAEPGNPRSDLSRNLSKHMKLNFFDTWNKKTDHIIRTIVLVRPRKKPTRLIIIHNSYKNLLFFYQTPNPLDSIEVKSLRHII